MGRTTQSSPPPQRPKGKGKAAATTSGPNKRAKTGSVARVPGWEGVVFGSPDQRERFVKLAAIPVKATRWVDDDALTTLGLKEPVARLLEGGGISKLYGMTALTHELLTREFLSSVVMNEECTAITFRVKNKNYTLTLDEFGEHLGLVRSRYQRAPDHFDNRALLGCMSDQNIGYFSNVRVNEIQHPALRLWFRILAGTLFGRHEVGSLNSNEAAILGGYLNVQRNRPFLMDVSYLVARHLVEVGEGRYSSLNVGGVITYLCESMDIASSDFGPPVEEEYIYLDLKYLQRSHHWVKRESGRWHFTVSKDPRRTLVLPCAALPELVPLPQVGDDVVVTLPNYRIPADLGRAHAAQPQPMAMIEDTHPQTPPTTHYEHADASHGRGHGGAPHAYSSHAPPSSMPSSSYFQEQFNYLRDQELAHFTYARQQFTHHAVNQNLMALGPYHESVVSGTSVAPHPSFYRGSNDPAGIFLEAGIDPNAWGAEYGGSYGGFGGQLLDDFGRFNLGGDTEPDDDET